MLNFYSGLIFGNGSVIGPVIGGAFADSSATWRWGFYINICIIGALAPVYFILIPSFKPDPTRSTGRRLRDLDNVGTTLSIGALVCLILGINFGGTLFAWSSAKIIALLILAGVIFLLFCLQQSFAIFTTERTRLFPVALLKEKEAIVLFILTAALNSAIYVPIYYIPIYFQFTRGDGPLYSAVRLLPLIVTVSFVILLNGAALSKGGYYMPWFLFGTTLSLVAGVLFCKFSNILLIMSCTDSPSSY